MDRVVVRDGLPTQRLADSFETALGLADGVAYARRRGQRASAPSSPPASPAPSRGFTIEEIEPRLFSFNSPQGACPACDGLGSETFFDAALVVPDDAKPLGEGAVAALGRRRLLPLLRPDLGSLARHFKVAANTPWARPRQARAATAILHGTGARSSPSATRTASAPTR